MGVHPVVAALCGMFTSTFGLPHHRASSSHSTHLNLNRCCARDVLISFVGRIRSGGVVRDLLTRRPPRILHNHAEIYAVATCLSAHNQRCSQMPLTSKRKVLCFPG